MIKDRHTGVSDFPSLVPGCRPEKVCVTPDPEGRVSISRPPHAFSANGSPDTPQPTTSPSATATAAELFFARNP